MKNISHNDENRDPYLM